MDGRQLGADRFQFLAGLGCLGAGALGVGLGAVGAIGGRRQLLVQPGGGGDLLGQCGLGRGELLG
ncbi:hypothetical protein HS041_28085 [Planomonospora sp. ID67723]|uniref:hypothetical protein n=1 Tax=Planomonospora sp. ID67723 TaxID=2738134 RepID=UPI0018C38650|nr:hypothetical protein [Planomonospora sp. ID67723]MBG0831596.1 hypothetical protein [Planomonospora sp. ID67723]